MDRMARVNSPGAAAELLVRSHPIGAGYWWFGGSDVVERVIQFETRGECSACARMRYAAAGAGAGTTGVEVVDALVEAVRRAHATAGFQLTGSRRRRARVFLK